MEEELNGWPEWSFLFRAFVEFSVPQYNVDLNRIEADLNAVLEFSDYSTPVQERAQRLYTILSSYVKGRPLRIIRTVPDKDGFQAWQLLCKEYQPTTRARSLAMAQAIMGYPQFERGRHLDGLLGLERLIEDFEKISKTPYPDELKISNVLRCLPNHLRQHLQLNLQDTTTYSQLRAGILSYEQTVAAWTPNRVLQQIQGTNSQTEPTAGPMDIDRIQDQINRLQQLKGSYKGKGKGKGEQKGKNKGKGKGDNKGKGKGDQKGKGKGSSSKGGKGKHDQPRKVGPCYVCGKQGHIAADCWSKDKVRAVLDDPAPETASATGSSNVPPSVAPTTGSNSTYRSPHVRRIQQTPIFRMETPPDMATCRIFDLTDGEELEWLDDLHGASIRHVFTGEKPEPTASMEQELQEQISFALFDMTLSDSDQNWTHMSGSPFPWQCFDAPDGLQEWYTSSDALGMPFQHELHSGFSFLDDMPEHFVDTDMPWFARASSSSHASFLNSLEAVLPFSQEANVCAVREEIHEGILDLGADLSVLPMNFRDHGEVVPNSSTSIRDAQGRIIPTVGSRIRMSVWVESTTGDMVQFTDNSVVARVTQPLFCLGKLLRQGWKLHGESSEQFLVRGDVQIPLVWRRNALAMKFWVDEPSIRYVVAVSDSLAQAIKTPGWKCLPDGTPCHVSFEARRFMDPSVTFPIADFPYRSTLVKNLDGQLELWECSEEYGIRKDKEECLELSGTRLVVTLVHSAMVDLLEYFGPDLSAKSDEPMNSTGPLFDPEPTNLPEEKQQYVVDEGKTKWVRYDQGLRQAPNTAVGGPMWATVYRRVVRDMQTGEVVADQETRGKSVQECIFQLDPRVKATETTFFYDVLAEPAADPEFRLERNEHDAVSVLVDGQAMTAETPLRELRQACRRLGLPQSGNKSQCFHRIVSHLEEGHRKISVELAHQAWQSSHREPVAQPLPRPPSQAERLAHEVNHIPFAEWCEQCVANRSREDAPSEPRPPTCPTFSLDYMYTGTAKADKNQMCLHLVGVDSWSKMVMCLPVPRKGTVSLKMAVSEVLKHVSQYAEVTFKADTEPPTKQLVRTLVEVRSKMGFQSKVEWVPPDRHQANPAERAIQTVRRLGNTLLATITDRVGLELTADHPIFAWAYRHSAWLLNRYAVTAEGRTPFEIAYGHPYTGKIAPFGSTVFGQALPMSKVKGLPPWTKAIYLGRQHESDLCILANSGGVFQCRSIRRCAEEWQATMVWSMKGLPWNWTDGVAHLGPKPVREPRIPSLAPIAEGSKEILDESQPLSKLVEADPSSSSSSGSSEKPESEAASDPPSANAGEVTPRATSMEDEEKIHKLLHTPPQVSERPKTKARPSPEKSMASQEDTVQLRMVQISESEYVEVDEHEPDEVPETSYVELPDFDATAGEPPALEDYELEQLDLHADGVEVERLLEKKVLLPLDGKPDDMTPLQTRHVRDWRWRQNQWIRRSRLVAKEFAFLDPTRPFLYAPGSVPVTIRLLAALAMSSGGKLQLRSADIKDAYLMVPQQEPVCVQISYQGEQRWYQLAFCLPGQRVGARAWHSHLTGVLARADLHPYAPTPSIFVRAVCEKSDTGMEKRRMPFVIMSHVDDLQILSNQEDADALCGIFDKAGFQLEKEGPCDVFKGGECSFLKRTFRMIDEGMLVSMSSKYIRSLVDLLELNGKKPKKTPMSPSFNKVCIDETPLSPEDCVRFRTAIGILIYISPERGDIQGAVRFLGGRVCSPRRGDFKELQHVVLYLSGTKSYCQLLPAMPAGSSCLNPNPDEAATCFNEPSLIEAFSDSDWAGSAEGRRSVSCNHFWVNGILIACQSKTQKSIALSSCEAEFVSAVSAGAEGLYIRNLVHAMTDLEPNLELRLDNAAARTLLNRLGVIRTRHIATGLLWIQQQVEKQTMKVKAISSQRNSSDLGTKPHGYKRLQYLMYVSFMYDADLDCRIGRDEYLEVHQNVSFRFPYWDVYSYFHLRVHWMLHCEAWTEVESEESRLQGAWRAFRCDEVWRMFSPLGLQACAEEEGCS